MFLIIVIRHILISPFQHVPEGKWKHDMFNKVDIAAPRIGGNVNKRVTLNVSNLDPALIGPEDLEVLPLSAVLGLDPF